MLYNLFLFKGKVFKVQGEDSKFNKFISLEDDPVANSLQKYRAKKAFKKSLKKKLEMKPAELLAFNKTNRQKGKAVIITKADKEIIIKKVQPK